MFILRPVHLFICLSVLAVAGCASTSVQVAQTSVGGVPRPKTVLVNDFVFSSNVAVVNRDFIARLERKLYNPTSDVVKAIAARRVGDEVVATIITILHYQAGLNAQPGSECGNNA